MRKVPGKAKCDRRKDRQTDRQKNRQKTVNGQSDPYVENRGIINQCIFY